jgi:hypothetical protein
MVAEPGRGGLQGSWLVLTTSGELKSFDTCGNVATSALLASDLGIDCGRPSSLVLSPNGRFAALANTYERTGVVVDLNSGTTTMRLARGNYYPEHCQFPLSFFEHNGRQLLIHATDWNRLDISDPATGELLTVREPTAYKRDEQPPAHYLDYFHCGLSVSPDGQWIADNGWSWHPVGIITTWSLTQWLTTNIWESEDGTSKKSLCWRDYFWDGPLCWVDNRTVAVWGLGEDDILLIRGVRLFDVESGAEKFSFAGPVCGEEKEVVRIKGKETTFLHRAGTLVFDQWLFSWMRGNPFSIWDISDGARLLEEQDFTPLGYHPVTKEFLSIWPDGILRLSRVLESV